MENRKCPNCGYELHETIIGSSLSCKCEHCGYAYCTTIAEGIEWDSRDYTIIIQRDNSATLNQIKMISSVSSLNFLESKKLLLSGGILLKDRATNIKSKIDKLSEVNIKFNVTPEFKY
jgi:Na+-translocating ferredoxin:NAD+ oxidoreductase RNF subunit RnfB